MMFRRVKSGLIDISIALGIVMSLAVAFPALAGLAQDIEQNLYPVATPVELIKVEEIDDENTLIWVKFDKLRGCEYLGLSWFEGSLETGATRVRLSFGKPDSDQSDTTRPEGVQIAGPWKLGMSKDALLNNSYAMLSHRCHPFWISKTQFYP
jgi:hypothetical protein